MKFEIGNKLGSGGYCVVYEAHLLDESNERTGEVFAVKRLLPEHQSDEGLRMRFQRESRLLDDELSHENIIPVVHRNVTDSDPYFIMPLADGNLREQLDAGKHVEEDWVIDRFRQILEGVAYAHDRDVIHRDLKPQNALVFEGATKVQISDFGLGKDLADGTDGVTKTNQWFGTEPYMPPEQFQAMKDAGPEVDVFQLGKVLMEMLTGQQPVVGVPTDLSALPEKFRYFVSRCCSEKPQNRFPNARAALEAFERIVTEPAIRIPAFDQLEELVKDWFEQPVGPDVAVTQEIDSHLRSNPSEEVMFTRLVPQLPDDLLVQYMTEFPDEFGAMLEIYDGHVSGGLPWEYCDVVAKFYRTIYGRTDRIAIQKLVLERLLKLGRAHNRYFVGDTVLRLLEEKVDPSSVAMAVDVIDGHLDAAAWLGAPPADHRLPVDVIAALERARAGA